MDIVHTPHITLEICKKEKDIGFNILSLPSHISYAIEPLNIGVFKPFKTAFRAYKDIWTMSHRGQRVRKMDLAK